MGTIPRNELLFNPEHPEAAPGFFKHSRQHSLAQRTPGTASLPAGPPDRQRWLPLGRASVLASRARLTTARIFKQSRQHSLAQRTPGTASLPAGPPVRSPGTGVTMAAHSVRPGMAIWQSLEPVPCARDFRECTTTSRDIAVRRAFACPSNRVAIADEGQAPEW